MVIGNFKVKVEKRPRYVEEDLCTGCGSCSEVCPIEIPNYYDMGIGMVKADIFHSSSSSFMCNNW